MYNMFFFPDDGKIPNNPSLPVLLYKKAFQNTVSIEETFHANNWKNSWSGGIFDYHHYHSNTHEVLGVLKGSAVLQIGGEQGETIAAEEGDVLLLPAGTGHKKISSSPDFTVIGAYPDGAEYNLKTEEDYRPDSIKDIANVPCPELDPVGGTAGPLKKEWARDIKTGSI